MPVRSSQPRLESAQAGIIEAASVLESPEITFPINS
jgi:hypothetical protein